MGYSFVVDGDIESFFDRVEHQTLLKRLEERRPGEMLMGLLRQWIEPPV
jgi:retron-type reverse transcriptase